MYVLPVSHKMLVTKCDRLTQYTRADQSNVTMLFTPSIKIRDGLKKKTSYLVTLSLKVGGGQDEITLLGAAKIVTRW